MLKAKQIWHLNDSLSLLNCVNRRNENERQRFQFAFLRSKQGNLLLEARKLDNALEDTKAMLSPHKQDMIYSHREFLELPTLEVVNGPRFLSIASKRTIFFSFAVHKIFFMMNFLIIFNVHRRASADAHNRVSLMDF